MRARLLSLTLACALAGLTACDAGVPATPPPAAAPPGSESSTNLLATMIDAQLRVAFHGVRRYEAHYSENGLPKDLVYTEEVWSDGDGRFALQPLDLIEPQLPPAEESLFLVLQTGRQGLLFRYRDIQVRDLEAFAVNYVATDAGQTVQVAGRTCAELVIEGNVAPDRRYILHVDAVNGLVLRAREELLDGTLVSLLEYLSLSLTPDLTNVVWFQSLVEQEELDPNALIAAKVLGFTPREPKMVPDGFKQIEFVKVVDPTDDDRPWARAVYTDGVDLLFLLQGQIDPPSHQVKPGTPQQPSEPDFVSALSIGSWTVLQCRLHGRDILAMGRLDQTVLADLVESLF